MNEPEFMTTEGTLIKYSDIKQKITPGGQNLQPWEVALQHVRLQDDSVVTLNVSEAKFHEMSQDWGQLLEAMRG